VIEVGAIPIMADIDETPQPGSPFGRVQITDCTKAIIPVHMCGAPAHIDRILDRGEEARAQGSETMPGLRGSLKGKKLGTSVEMGYSVSDYYKDHHNGRRRHDPHGQQGTLPAGDWYHDHGHDHKPQHPGPSKAGSSWVSTTG